MARDHSRFRKLLQVQRHHLVNAELAVRWWAHFDVFHFYTSVPIHRTAAVSQFWLHRETFSATHGLHTTIGLFSIPAHGLCHHLAKASQTTTSNRSATSFPGQAHEQPPGRTCGDFWAMPSVTYGAETSHTLPYTSFIASLHTYLNHRHASLPFDLACASGA